MADQAETLRRLMRERSAQDPGADQEANLPTVLAFMGARPGAGTSTVLANLAAILARSGWSVAAVTPESGRGRMSLADAFGVDISPGDAPVQQLEQDLWLVTRANPSPEEPGSAEIVFLDLGSRESSAGRTALTALSSAVKAETVILLTPDPADVAAITAKLSGNRDQKLQAGVIVNHARDGAEAQKVFRSLKESLNRFSEIGLEYLGHCGHDEKIIQAVRKRKILLDLESGAPSVRCFELLAKRLRARYLEGAEVDDDRIVTRRRIPASRFREEPARSAPGNGTGFWRILLGEVKA